MDDSSKISLKALLQGVSKLSSSLDSSSTCVLPISVGWSYHEGEQFQATLRLVENKFSQCRIVVCGTLQRYSLVFLERKLDSQFKSYKDYGRFLGDQWIARNIPNKNGFFQIERWDDTLSRDLYDVYKRKIEDLIQYDNQFFEIFNQTAIHVYENFKIHKRFGSQEISREDFIKKSMEYLIEESAAAVSWSVYNETVLLYPKSLGGALAHTLNFFLGEKRKVLQHLQIKFRKLQVL